jgi:hypothetical protein
MNVFPNRVRWILLLGIGDFLGNPYAADRSPVLGNRVVAPALHQPMDVEEAR